MSLRWGTVADAIGYRVLHASDPDGPFSVAADVNVRSGLTSAADGVTNVWSDRWTYHPPALASESFDGVPDEVHYVELLTEPGAVRYFQVIAYNEVRASTASRTICAAPSGGDPC